jgi:hypothetical protein
MVARVNFYKGAHMKCLQHMTQNRNISCFVLAVILITGGYSFAEEAGKYKVDAALSEAITEVRNPKRDRDKAERLLLKYIENNPKTPFLPELYFYLGELYTNTISSQGEKSDLPKAKGYYAKAHAIFGDKYCTANDCAWSYLVGNRDASLAAKREYYDWRLKTKELKEEDIWPYRSAEICMLYGKPLEMSEADKAQAAENWKQNSKMCIEGVERTLFMFADVHASEVYAKEYPDTELGRQSKAWLQKRTASSSSRPTEYPVTPLACSSPTTKKTATTQSAQASSAPSTEASEQDGDAKK